MNLVEFRTIQVQCNLELMAHSKHCTQVCIPPNNGDSHLTDDCPVYELIIVITEKREILALPNAGLHDKRVAL